MTNTARAFTVAHLSGKALDYQMYLHACKVLNHAHTSKKEFEEGYEKGQFHFSTDKNLLADLLETYRVNVQFLAGEWLASNTQGSAYSSSPLEAVCRLILLVKYGTQGIRE
jgi:hypothetical protein